MRWGLAGMLMACAIAAPGTAQAASDWLAPVTLAPASSNPAGLIFVPAVAMNERGDAVVAAPRVRDNGTPSTSDDQVVIVASYRPAGGNYGPVETVSVPPVSGAREVDAAIDAAGNALLVFTTNNGTNVQVQAAHRGPGTGWSTPRDISPVEAGNNASAVRIDGNADGDVGVFWVRSSPSSAYGAVGTTTGAFTSLGSLSSTAGSSVYPQGGGVAVDDAGNASWTWERDITGAPGGQYLVEVRDKPAGAALLGAVTLTLAIDGAHAEGPAIDLDPSGRGIISYGFNQSSGPEEIRYSARSSPAGNWAAGTWSTDVRRASQDGQVTVNYGSRVQMGSDGSTVLAYTTSDNKPWAATRLVGQAFGDHHALSDTPGISLSIAVAPNGGAVIAFVKTTVDGALVSARAPGASTFAAAQEVDRAPVAGFTTYVYGIDTAIDGAGNAIAATPDDVCSGACSTFESRIDAVHYDAAPPMLRSVSVPGSALPGATAAFSADAFDQFSTPSIAWDFGDGTSGSGGSASHAFAQPGSYAVKVTATDSLGNATSETRNVTVAFADADGDGAASNVDCDDANPAVRPGAKEIPGNGLDDDCSAGDALKRVGTRLSAAWRVGKRSTAVKRLRLRKLPAGAVVTVGCTGRGCPLKSRRLTFKKARKSASLTGLFNRRVGKRRKHVVVARLRPGTKVTIIVGAPGRAPRTTVYTIRAGKPPAVARA